MSKISIIAVGLFLTLSSSAILAQPPREGAPRDGAPREGGQRGGEQREGGFGRPEEGRGGMRGFGPGGGANLGQIFPAFVRSMLGLSEQQNKELDALQAEVNERVKKILTAEQNTTLENLKRSGPGERGFGGRGFEGRGFEGRGPEGRGFEGRGQGPGGNADLVEQLMENDKNKDGQLTKDELPERLQGLMQRADKNNDGKLTKEELLQMPAGGRPSPDR